jgi:DnaJ-class molecular chaperone
VRLPVHATTAVLGGEAQVPTLEGGTVRLKIPEATQSGQVFRVKGRGMPVVKQLDERGDLYATVEIIVPHTISPEQRAHYEALRELERGGTTHSAA